MIKPRKHSDMSRPDILSNSFSLRSTSDIKKYSKYAKFFSDEPKELPLSSFRVLSVFRGYPKLAVSWLI